VVDINLSNQGLFHDATLEHAGLRVLDALRKQRGSKVFIAIWSGVLDRDRGLVEPMRPDVIVEKLNNWREEAATITLAYLGYRLDSIEQTITNFRTELRDYVERISTFVVFSISLLVLLLTVAVVIAERLFPARRLALAEVATLVWMLIIRLVGEKKINVTDWALFRWFCHWERALELALLAAILIELFRTTL